MCLTKRTMPRISRILLALGNLCMFSGLTMSRFGGDPNQHQANWSHFLSGFLLGLAITFLFAALYKARRNPSDT